MSSPSPSPSPPSPTINSTPPRSIPTALPLLMPPSSRRLPPPCWTPDETSALISAYRQKWYSLRRSNLRAAHWQEVADEVHRRCPSVSPPKTAVQCRHKTEKLRKRYRSDLQRAKSLPHHRFSSSWQYFNMMDEMEKGPTAIAAPIQIDEDEAEDVVGDDDDEDYALMNNHDPKRDFGLRIKIQRNAGLRSPDTNFDQNPNPRYRNSGLRPKMNFDENPNPSYGNSGFQPKKYFADFDGNPNPNPNGGYNYKPKYFSINSFSPSPHLDDGVRYSSMTAKNGSNGSSAGPSGLNENMDSMMAMRKKEKKKKSGLGKREREVEEDEAAMEMVDAIRKLGEGFMRMEKMKMDMIRETERTYMEMEMKRTQMILESQHRIVEALAKGWADSIKVNKDTSC